MYDHKLSLVIVISDLSLDSHMIPQHWSGIGITGMFLLKLQQTGACEYEPKCVTLDRHLFIGSTFCHARHRAFLLLQHVLLYAKRMTHSDWLTKLIGS
jgi:hypothetical protein